jgi:hypothetical protein
MSVGPHNIKISKVGRYFYSLLDNRTILGAKSEKEVMEKTLPVLAILIKSLCKNANIKTIKYANNNLDSILQYIKKNLEPAEIFVLEMKPDEITDNKPPVDTPTITANILNSYKESLKKFGETVENIHHSSDILLKTHLAKDLWGNKGVTEVFNSIKADIAPLNYDDFESNLEHSENHIKALDLLLNRKLPVQTKEIAGKVIEGFSEIKSFMSVLAQSLQNLYTMDSTFQKHTGYPATWFLCSSTFMDFLFEYENLIEHLIKSADIEQFLIEPLLVLKIKTGA